MIKSSYSHKRELKSNSGWSAWRTRRDSTTRDGHEKSMVYWSATRLLWFFFQDSLHVVSTNNPTTRMRFCQIEGENARRNFTVLDMYYSRWDWLFWISECFVNVYSYCFVLFLNSNLSTNLRKYYALFVPFWQFGSLLWSWIVGKGIW